MRKELVIIPLVLGLAFGFLISQGLDSGGECGQIEDQIRQNQNFTGTVACYPPGEIDVNLSEKLENSTELKCVCRKVVNDRVSLYPITVTK